ncbi:hypothetical protein FHETE_4773 [Fusarium heterosporum]|uniref:AB hydrolase-1 domain-containing protein n=1 Tax=Fusarium heterosporum TaxID=42747 RepID=A0A8H5TDA3_FUSHE|nr:hypothetical protein FHETE_4773 [Fusarium heterosporum]
MSAKSPLDTPAWTEPRRKPSPSKWKLFGAGVLTVAAFHWLSPPMHCSHHHEENTTYLGESLEWKPCGEIANRTVECSKIDVPIDQFNPHASNKTFNVPLIRVRGKDGSPNLMLNPGGPGGSGFEFLHRRGAQLSTIVGDGFHLLSFDPRGINSSTPRASCYPTEEARQQLGSVHALDINKDGPEIYAWTHNYVKACEDTMGEHGKYINTPQTAADMNSILDAVGQKDMYYWGFSYGTLLGQTYATLFPERSHRVIIDGVVNQFEWYQERVESEDLVDTENVLDGVFKECIKSGNACPLSSVADTWQDLKTEFLSFMDELKEQPMDVYINSTTYGLLDYQKIWFGAVFPTLYKPERWPVFAERMEHLLNGNATESLLEYGLDGGENYDALYFVRLNDAPSGPEHWPQDLQSLLDIVQPTFNRSLFAPDDLVYLFAGQQWRIPKTHNYVPRKGVETAHPLLILTTSYDPVCPLVSARSALGAFEDSRLVEVKGYGHCSVAVPSLCLAKHVRGFLYNGTLPASNETQCDVDEPYFKAKGMVDVQSFEHPEDQAIHLAQVELAKDPYWPRVIRK